MSSITYSRWIETSETALALAKETLPLVYEYKKAQKLNLDSSRLGSVIDTQLRKIKSYVAELESELSLAEKSNSLPAQQLQELEIKLINLTKEAAKVEDLFIPNDNNSFTSLNSASNSARERLFSTPRPQTTQSVGSGSTSKPLIELQNLDGIPIGDSLQNNQLIQLQKEMVEDQDRNLDRLSETLHRQKHIGLTITEELEYHSELLAETDEQLDSTAGRLQTAKRRLRLVSETASNNFGTCSVIIILVLLLILVLILKKL